MTDKLTLTGETLREPQDSMTSQVEQSEDRMRRALEQLGGGASNSGRAQRSGNAAEAFSGSRKHRFVQDGDVSVTHVQTRRDRSPRSGGPAAPTPETVFSGSRDALAEERGLRLRAERAAQDAQSMIATLQTKLGHAEIALTEAREAVHAEAEAAARLQAVLQGRDARISSLQERLDAAEKAERTLEQQGDAVPSMAPRTLRTAAQARRTKATRSVLQSQKALGPDAEEPKPVRWWVTKKD